jgi:RNA polymerase sigma factor (sigma-70 family)
MRADRPRFDVLGELQSLRRYARALLRDGADSEDLVHDALVRAYERRSQFRPDGNLRSWLLSILHNVFVDRLRSRRAEAGRMDRMGALADDTLAPPQEHAVRLAEVWEAFHALPDEQRAALHLVAIEGLTYQDAASALGIPLGTLMSRIGRARAALRAFESAGSGHKARFKIVGGPS